MIRTVIDKIFGTKSERDLKKIQHYVDDANKFTAEFEKLSDEQLKAKTQEFKDRLAKGETLDQLLPEAFAVVRLAAQRVIGLRPYDVQLLGGIVLHQGKIAEMGTGEGKTLVAVLPSYLNALTGKGVHVVTVNDYLARRDRQWMGPIHEFLGLTVGYINHDMDSAERREMYAQDITYVTNNELGFDYLRDNMVINRADRVLRPLDDAAIYRHLAGRDAQGRDVIGLYPMLPDETCYLLALDFDDANWQDCARAVASVCRAHSIPFALERSRSGQGAHV